VDLYVCSPIHLHLWLTLASFITSRMT
jgi:hypothetical protein